ncbi:winged helix-turn-helix domain-containing protein [Lacticaseibacillus parahuelsenbergensis]|uniref:Winged helix-turn-helix domain-containing protein n=1 Tax=Lacticaseibacillus parahuelsenbergensis TaxID=3068305 RepID=A0ABY9L3X5_9LACO|nr:MULTISPECIES: winged helix-turn-helix domain-containing protein [Lacticaseibacillus]MDE3281480.1 winged helix-turn-helix domain-containing protein [Lacticaseibacillus casei]WLV78398.1 winged helix-turn-helix domain-containing protein [Lacticaseibacillus sp. NCIMB 15471]
MHRSPKYVQIYNQILKMIKQGQLAPGSKLPSEEVLTNEFEVSRVTLRTALSLLKEDGLIRSIHGQGHFVEAGEKKTSGIETLGNPILKGLVPTIERREAYYHENQPSEFTDQLFDSHDEPYDTLNIWYQNNGENIGNTLAILLPETVTMFRINLNQPDSIVNFLEKSVYQKASSSSVSITLSDRQQKSFRRTFSDTSPLILMTEDIFGLNGERLLQNKHYIPANLFRVNVVRIQHDLQSQISPVD